MASTMDAAPSEEGNDVPSLARQINASIASSHTTLNRLILDRMPLAVPPHTETPSAYITGLLHIGAVYVAFESVWQNLLGIHTEIAPIPYTFPFNSSSNNSHSSHDQEQQHLDHGTTPPPPIITARTRRVLEHAYSPTLLRAPRIKADVQAMTGWPDHVFAQQLHAAGTSGRLGAFTRHIRDAVHAKPHLLLAYAYTLYLALLSGGSYIRTELLYLDRAFWEATPSPVLPGLVECSPAQGRLRRKQQQEEEEEARDDDGEDDDDEVPDATTERRLPLDFLDFDPPLGAHPRQQTKRLKADFKARFAAADALLADPERRDIVAECTLLFHSLEGVVAQLDELFGGVATTSAAAVAPAAAKTSVSPPPRAAWGGVGARLRDSIAIAKGRLLLRARRKSSGGSMVMAATTGSSTRLSSVSAGGSGGEKASAAQRGDMLFSDKASSSEHEQGDLAREAVVPRAGFRTIRYDDGGDLARGSLPDRVTASNGGGGRHAAAPHGGGSSMFDGASDYCCPMSRAPAAGKLSVVGSRSSGGGSGGVVVVRTDVALYAIVSNFVLLAGVIGVFVAWLWVRHGDGGGGRVMTAL